MMKDQYREMLKNQNVAIQEQPQFVSIFRKSEAVSTTKGKSHFVMRKLSHRIILKEWNILGIRYKYENRIKKINDEMND